MTAESGRPRTYVEGPEPRWPTCERCKIVAKPGERCQGRDRTRVCPFHLTDDVGHQVNVGGIISPSA